jgi:uncharacterized membrane protein
MGRLAIQSTIDLDSPAEVVFALLREVEKWPVWLSFSRSIRLVEPGPLSLRSELFVSAAIPGEEEELFEVERFVEGQLLSFVGAFSVRRRLEFQIEGTSERSCRVVARLDYPTYGGVLGALLDGLTARRRLASELGNSLVILKGLAESDDPPSGD